MGGFKTRTPYPTPRIPEGKAKFGPWGWPVPGRVGGVPGPCVLGRPFFNECPRDERENLLGFSPGDLWPFPGNGSREYTPSVGMTGL